MTANEEVRRASEATVAFESTIQDVVLTAFASGAKVEGEWRIDTDVVDVPNWVVTVARADGTDEGGYEPTAIEEG